MRKTLILLALFVSVFPSSVFSGPPERWDVTIQASAPHNLDIWHGESLDFRPRFFSYGAPWSISTSATVTLYWSTNNFATAPWATNGTVLTTDTGRVTVAWSPACDAGASTYQYFVGVSEPSGLLYRARGIIRMQTSPGFTPSTAPLPVWDGWTNNYTYATYAAFLSLSNALVAAETASSNTAAGAASTASAALVVAQAIQATAFAACTTGGTALAAASVASASAASVQTNLTTHTNLTLSAGAHGGLPTPAQIGAAATNGNASFLTNWPATLVQSQQTSVVFANWKFTTQYGAAIQSMFPLGGAAYINDSGQHPVMYFDPDNRALYDITGATVASFRGPFAVGPDGTNLPVYATLANHEARISAALTNASDFDASGSAATAATSLSNLMAAVSNSLYVAITNEAAARDLVVAALSNYCASAVAAVATNAVDPTARASAASKPSYDAVTNIATSIVSGYAAPSFPVYDYGTHSNVVFVLSNSVLYLYGP